MPENSPATFFFDGATWNVCDRCGFSFQWNGPRPPLECDDCVAFGVHGRYATPPNMLVFRAIRELVDLRSACVFALRAIRVGRYDEARGALEPVRPARALVGAA